MGFWELKKLRNKKKEQDKDNRGLTLVEVICAVAVFSLIAVTVGGIVAISSRTYRNGSVETAVQQEAQLAANRIGDIIQDSVSAEFIGGVNTEGSYGTLVMSDGVDKHAVSLADGSTQLMYGEAPASAENDAIALTSLLAEHIVSFGADTTRFADTKTIRLDITVEDNGREYVMSYNMTARNDDVTLEAVPAVRTAAIIMESRIILEPGQTDYEIPVSVVGSSQGIEAVSADDTQVHASCTLDNKLKVSVEKTAGVTNSVVNINIATKEKDGAGNALATTTIAIQIRRVDEIAVASSLLSGEDGKAGAQYKFVSSATRYTPYLARKVTAAWDADYKNPYEVQWNYEGNFQINGAVGSFEEYFEVVEKQEELDTPYLIIKLKKDMVVGSALTVEAVSKHAAIDGGNKCGMAYNTEVKASAFLAGPGLDGKQTLILEPKESYQTTLPIASCDMTTTPDIAVLNGRGTTLSFADGEFKIQLGKDEKGDSNGKITIELRAAGDVNVSNVRTIEIYVRRLQSMELEVKQLTGEGHPIKEPLLAGADYQFCTRMKGTNMEKTDEETEEEFLPNPYAVEFSWEFRINGKLVNVTGAAGSAIWDKYAYEEKTGKNTLVYDDPAANPGNEYFKLVDLGTNKEQPCINFMLKKDFPLNAELTVTAKALHPAGKDAQGTLRNKTGEAYVEGGIIATATLEGEKSDKIIDPDDPFDDSEIDYLSDIMRGQDYSNFKDWHETQNFDWSVGYEGKWFMRTREILGKDENGNILYGPWTTYRRLLENSSAKKLNAMETRSLLADKRYQLQMAFMAIDPNTRTIYWPYDTSLSAKGSGTGFEGYHNRWDESTQFTLEEAYSSIYNIGRAYVGFRVGDTYYNSYGSLDSPVVLHAGESFQIDLWGSCLEYGHYQQKCYARVQELVGNTWVEVGNKGWSIQDRSSFFLIKDIKASAKGTYRISFKLVDNGSADWTVWNGDIWNPIYTPLENTEYLLCGSNGTRGYLYIRIE